MKIIKLRGNMRNNNDIIEGNLIIRKDRKSEGK